MKKTIHILLAMLLLSGLFATAQIKPMKRNQSSKSKTEQTKNKKSSNSTRANSSSQKNQSSSNRSVPAVVRHVMDDMVYVEGDTFTMGGGHEKYTLIGLIHQVKLSSFYISKYEVTQELWQAVMGKNPSHFKGDLRRPVEQVSWNDCQVFITRLNQLTGKHFRLPTEAEWEFAARGGKQSLGYKYAGSNDINNVAWIKDNSGEKTHPVGQKTPNELGLYDMSGNVDEWCQDWFGEFSEEGQTNPAGPNSGSARVQRGGSFNFDESECRVYWRRMNDPSEAYYRLGLRLAASSL